MADQSASLPMPDAASGQNRGLTIEQAIATAYAHWNAGQANQAEILCQRVLALWPGNPEALHLLGLMAHNWNNLDLAIDYLRKACQSPRAPAIYFSNLAEMYRQKNVLDEAETFGRRAVALDPTLVAGWNNLGIVLQEAGKHEESLLCLERVVTLKPDYAEAYNNLGNTFKRLGRLDRAQACYAKAIELSPEYPEAHSNLSNLLKDHGDFDHAAAEAKHAIDINPRLADAYINAAACEAARLRHEDALRWLNALLAFAPDNTLGLAAKVNSLIKLDRNDEALTAARRAALLAPNSGDAQNALGQALQALGFYDEALAVYQKAAVLPSIVPEQGYLNQGALLAEINRMDEARAAYGKALDVTPLSAAALFNMSEQKIYTRDDPDIARMEDMLAQNKVQGHSDRMALRFALSKAWLDAGDAERAFEHLGEGNRMKRATIHYDSGSTVEWMEKIARLFPASLFRQKAIAGMPSDLPVFVIGMPRSGTTLIEQILAAHPDVTGAGELSALRRVISSIRDVHGRTLDYPENIFGLQPDGYAQIGKAYLAETKKLAKGRKRLVDKMPANFLYAGVIALSLPGARIVHCRRDAVDTCLSCYTKLFAAEQNFTYDLAELGQFYRGYAKLMEHWRRVLPPQRFIEIDYEAVVDDLETEARRLVDFCGLAWNEACLSFHKSNRPVRTASVNQVRQPVYKRSVGRWKKYAPHLRPLLEALGVGMPDAAA